MIHHLGAKVLMLLTLPGVTGQIDQHPRRDWAIRMVVLSAAAGFDGWTTYKFKHDTRALAMGMREGNPQVRSIGAWSTEIDVWAPEAVRFMANRSMERHPFSARVVGSSVSIYQDTVGFRHVRAAIDNITTQARLDKSSP